MKKKLLNIFILLNIFKIFDSEIQFDTIENYSFVDVKYSTEKDLAQCTCNISLLCDYNCPCDTNCTEEDINKFNYEEMDFSRYNKNRMEDFKCKSIDDNFKYNKKRAGINVRDHIFSLMCIHYDKSGDMGEFYLEEPKDPDEKANEWVYNFFIKDVSSSNEAQFYKPDSNGYCMNSSISEYKNNEYSCLLQGDIKGDVVYGDENNTRTNGVKKENNLEKTLKTYSSSKIIDFVFFWNNTGNDNSRPNGYMQGKPIRIIVGEKQYDQFFFPLIKNDGSCLHNNEDVNKSISMKTILFKNNAIYSCKINSPYNYTNTTIYQLFFKQNMKLCSSPVNCDNDAIINNTVFNDDHKGGVNIQLDIYTSKEGKEYSPYEIIKYSFINITSNENNLLVLNIKFIDISYSSFINSKNGKITSLIKLPSFILEALKPEE